MKIVIKIQLKIVIFTPVKNCCILNGRVFVMNCSKLHRRGHIMEGGLYSSFANGVL